MTELTERLEAAEPTLAGITRAYRAHRAFAQERPEGFRLILSSVGDPGAPERVSVPVLRVTEDLVGKDRVHQHGAGRSFQARRRCGAGV